MFWIMLFPIILSVLFQMSLANITTAEEFQIIKIAVIDNNEFSENSTLKSVLDSVSKDDENRLFEITYTTVEEAETLLKDSKISGYINSDNGLRLTVKNSGINQTIIKIFLDDYIQTSATIQNIIKEDSSAIQNGLLANVFNRNEYLKETSAGSANPNTTVHYFYTIIAMACLYGGFIGLKEVMMIQANQSAQGARVNIAPTHKMKVFIVSMLAALTIQLAVIIILLLFLMFVLKVDFGNQFGYILLTCIAGTFTGVTFGTFISSIIKKGEGIKVGVLITGSMTMSFLSGMMFSGIKFIINQKAPIVNYLNPANLIADSFYALYYYDNNTQYFINLTILLGIGLIFSTATYFVLRRQKYANI